MLMEYFIQSSTTQLIANMILLGCVTFIWRYLFSFSGLDPINPRDDSFVHLFLVKNHSFSPFSFKNSEDDRFLVKSRVFYPQLFHRIVAALLSFKGFMKYGKFVNPVLETLFNLYLFIFTYKILNTTASFHQSIYGATAVSVLYLFSPIMVFFPGRLANIGARLFGYVVGITSFILTIEFLESTDFVLLPIIVLFNLVILFSSQFTLQAILFLNVLASIISLNAVPLLPVSATLGVAFIIAPRGTVYFFKNKWGHIVWYYRALKGKKIDLLKDIYRQYWRKLLLFSPPYLALFFYLPSLAGLWGNSIIHWMIVYIAASLVMFSLIFLPFLKQLGEAHRYLEYSHPLVYVILIYLSLNTGVYLPLIFLLFLNFLSSVHFLFRYHLIPSGHQELFQLVEFLKNNTEKIILPIPFKLSFYMAISLQNKFVASISPVTDKRIMKKYDLPIHDFETIHELYPFDWIVCEKKWLKTYGLENCKIIYRNSAYFIVQR